MPSPTGVDDLRDLGPGERVQGQEAGGHRQRLGGLLRSCLDPGLRLWNGLAGEGEPENDYHEDNRPARHAIEYDAFPPGVLVQLEITAVLG